MDKMRVSKMGNKFVVLMTDPKYAHKDMVMLKPKGIDIRVLVRISKSGDKLMAIIPKNYREYFKHKSEVYISKDGKG